MHWMFQVLLIVLGAAGVGMFLYWFRERRNRARFSFLFQPVHVIQVAKGLRWLMKDAYTKRHIPVPQLGERGELPRWSSDRGLRIALTMTEQENEVALYFSVSVDPRLGFPPAAHFMVVLTLVLLRVPPHVVESRVSQHGVFHVAFVLNGENMREFMDQRQALPTEREVPEIFEACQAYHPQLKIEGFEVNPPDA